jgi:hypothetical protein
MRSFKMPERLDRETFWMYTVPLVIGHVVLALMAAHGSGLAGADLVVVMWLALVVGSRFRDIGWRPWIGISFVLVTIVALPLVALVIAIAVNPGRGLGVVSAIGLVTGPLNLVLFAVAGSVPGTVPLEMLVMPFADEQSAGGELVPETLPPTTVTGAITPLAIGGACVAILVLGVVVVRSFLSTPASPAVSSSTLPRANSYATVRPSSDQPAATTGLTKDTKDFLRQFSAQGGQAGAGRAPPSGNSIWPDPSKVLPQQKAAP